VKDSKHRIRLRDGRELQFHSPRLGPDSEAVSLLSFIPDPTLKIEVEIGPGKGEHLWARARRYPQHFFIGIDRRLDRSRLTQNKLQQLQEKNGVVIREDARRFFQTTMPPIHKLHVYQPDPWPKARHHKHRFFRSPDARSWAEALEAHGQLRVSTDHWEYFLEIVDIVDSWGFMKPTLVARKCAAMAPPMTHFESIFLKKGQDVFKAIWTKTK